MTHSIAGLRAFAAASFALVLLLVGCTGQREPARKLMDDIEAAVAMASDDAAKYVPDRLNDVQTKLDDLKTAFNAQDYQAVLARGPALESEAQGLAGAAAARKADLLAASNRQWSALAGTVPDEVNAVHDRIEMLGQRRNRRLATGVDLESAKTGFEQATSQWSKAQGAFGNGNLDEAVRAGKDAKSQLESVAGTLKLELPADAALATVPADPR